MGTDRDWEKWSVDDSCSGVIGDVHLLASRFRDGAFGSVVVMARRVAST